LDILNETKEVIGHFKELYAYVKNMFGPFREYLWRILSNDFSAFCSVFYIRKNVPIHQE
jgi:hypothetical protein